MDLWQEINREGSFLSLQIPLVFFGGALAYSSVQKRSFHDWASLHNVYNISGMLLAIASLYYNDDTIVNEKVIILWSIGYFFVDLIDCVWRMDVAFTIHAFFCVFLGILYYHTPVCLMLRTVSKSLFLELSSPFLHLAKKTRKPIHFALFALVFTLCRILWMPYILYECRSAGMPFTHHMFILQSMFYGLNLYWYVKILRILFFGQPQKTKDE